MKTKQLKSKQMKSNLKFLAIIAFLGLFLHSCSDDDTIDPNADKNPERFENIEIGNSNFEAPQSGIDLHTEFDYTGASRVTQIYFDITPINVSEPNEGEAEWQVSSHLVPENYYEGQLNPHIHYHMFYDSENQNFPEVRPAKGIYSLKITVVEEDNSESYITKEFKVVKKFSGIKIGTNNQIVYGSDVLHTEFQFDAGNKTVSEIKYKLWFKEWRDGQNVAIGNWDNVVTVLPESLYENQSNPHINYQMALNPEFPVESYWLTIVVQELGENEAVKVTVPLSIIN